MNGRAPLVLLVLVGAALTLALASLDLPAAADGHFWSDGATYYAAALSLAFDRDLVYEARDVLRVRREWGGGPAGIFLKRASGGLALRDGFPWAYRVPPHEPRVYYAKAFAYPVAAAPFARVLGVRGLLLFNGLCLAGTLLLGYLELRRRAAPWPAGALAGALLLATVTPAYGPWLQPEAFNLFLVAGALVAWSRGFPLLSAVVFAIATYSKPTHVLLALPLGASPLLEAVPGLWTGLRESLRRGLVLGGCVAALYGANALVTGEVNYQGGERKTFYERFPFESHGVTFGNSGIWMTTEHVGPRVSGESDDDMRRGEGAALPREELEQAFLRNLGYFWVGRFAGALPYFFPVALAAFLFAATGPRDRAGWLALGALLVSYVFYIWLIPANWFGGAGAIGNRYFLSLVPLAFFFAPRGREWPIALLGTALGLVVALPILAAPVRNALEPWRAGLRPLLLALPLERTMLNDLPIFLEVWRKKQPIGDAEGDPQANKPGSPESYWLYFPDDSTHGRERAHGQEGFWLRPGREAEVLVRAQEPVKEMRVTAWGAPGTQLSLRCGRGRAELRIAAASGAGFTPAERAGGAGGGHGAVSSPSILDAPAEAVLHPTDGVIYYDSFVYVLRASASGAVAGESERAAFVTLALKVEPRR